MKKQMMRWVFSILCIAVFLPVFDGYAMDKAVDVPNGNVLDDKSPDANVQGDKGVGEMPSAADIPNDNYLNYMIWDAPREEIKEEEFVEIGYSAVADIDLGALGGKEGQYAVYYEDEEGNTRTEKQEHDGYPYILIKEKNGNYVWVGKLSDDTDDAEPAPVLRFHPYQHGVQPEYLKDAEDLLNSVGLSKKDGNGELNDNGELIVPIGIISEEKQLRYILQVDADAGYQAKQDGENLEYKATLGVFAVKDPTKDVQIYRYNTEIGTISGIAAAQNWVVPVCENKGINPEGTSVQVALKAEAAEGYAISGLQWKYRIVKGENKGELQKIPGAASSGGTILLKDLADLRTEDITAIEIGLYEGDVPVKGEPCLTILKDDFFPVVELGNPQINVKDDGKGSIKGEIIIAQGKNHLGEISDSAVTLQVGGKDWTLEGLTPSENGYDFTASGDLPVVEVTEGETAEAEAADVQLTVKAKGSNSEKEIEYKAEIKDVKINKEPRIALEDVRITLHASASEAIAEGTVRLYNMEGVSEDGLTLYFGRENEGAKWPEDKTEFAPIENEKDAYSFKATSGEEIGVGAGFEIWVQCVDTESGKVTESDKVSVKVKKPEVKPVECEVQWDGDKVKGSGTLEIVDVDIAADQLKVWVLDGEKERLKVEAAFTDVKGEAACLVAGETYAFSFEYGPLDAKPETIKLQFSTDVDGDIGSTGDLDVQDKPKQAVEITAVDVRNQEYDTLLHGIKVYAALPGGEQAQILPNSDGSFEVQLDEATTMKGKVSYRKKEESVDAPTEGSEEAPTEEGEEAQTEESVDTQSKEKEWSDGLPAYQAGVCNQTYQIKVEAEGFAPQYLQPEGIESEGGEDWLEATINIVPFEVYVDVTAKQTSDNIYDGNEQEIDFKFEVSCVQAEAPGSAQAVEPSSAPTGEPSHAPTEEPSSAPTGEPSSAPTAEPSSAPTGASGSTKAGTHGSTVTETPGSAATEAPNDVQAGAPGNTQAEEYGKTQADVDGKALAEVTGSVKAEETSNALKAEIATLGHALTDALNEAYSGNKIKGIDAGDYPKEYTIETRNPNFVLKAQDQELTVLAQDQKLTVQVVATIEKETVTIPTETVCYVYDGEEHAIGTGSLGEIEKVLSRSENYYRGAIDTDKLDEGHDEVGVYVTELDCGGLSDKNHIYSIDPWIMVILKQSIDPNNKKMLEDIEQEIQEAVERGTEIVKDEIINDYACYDGMTVELVRPEVEYNGDSQAPELKFKQKKTIDDKETLVEKELVEGTDYELHYYKVAEPTVEVKGPDFKSAGSWYISVTGIGNYAGEFKVDKPYTINPKGNVEATVSIENWTYDRKCAGTTEHPLNVHSESDRPYNATYCDAAGNPLPAPPSNAGTYTVQVTWPETDNYAEATASAVFSIEPRSLEDVSIEQEQYQLEYTGEDRYPSISVQYSDIKLGDQDYWVNPGDADVCNVGDVSVTLEGIGNFTGSYPMKYEIVPAKVTGAEAKIEGWTYDGQPVESEALPIRFYISEKEVYPKKKTITCSLNGEEVDAPKDVGIYSVVAKWEVSENHQEAVAETSFEITPAEVVICVTPAEKDFGNADPELEAEISVNGGDYQPIDFSNPVELLKGDNCTMQISRERGEDGENADEYPIEITLTDAPGKGEGEYLISDEYTEIGNYKYKMGKGANLTIKPRELTDADVTAKDATYDGNPHKPVVKVGDEILREVEDEDGDGDYTLELTKGNDYTSSGEKKVVIEGTGNYSGTVTVKYEIGSAAGSMELTNVKNGSLTAVRGEDDSETVHIEGTILLDEPLPGDGKLLIQIYEGETELMVVEASDLTEDRTKYEFEQLDVPVGPKTKAISVSATARYDAVREVQIEGVEVSVAHEMNKLLPICIAAAAVSLIGLIACLCLRAKMAKKIRLESYRELNEDSLRSNRTIHQEEDE